LNLMTPSFPNYFNTLYDPVRSDFARGYPYSMRSGSKTGISHGLWLGSHDVDALTRLSKVSARNTDYIDVSQTVPKGSLLSLSALNLFFDKEVIGPALLLVPESDKSQSEFSDLFSGWAAKVIADHLGVGVKSGTPYVLKSSQQNPFNQLKGEFGAYKMEEELINFFQTVVLSTNDKPTIESTYLELSEKLRDRFQSTNYDCILKWCDAMHIWLDLWGRLNRNCGEDGKCAPDMSPVASRSSMGPKSVDSTCAVFTIVHNEEVFLPVWLRYYQRHVPVADMWIMDHNTVDGSTSAQHLPPDINYMRVHGDASFMPHVRGHFYCP
jgi:hypothetical protein